MDREPGGETLAILDVGHGNSAVLIDSGGTSVIDTGPGSALLQFLDERGIDRLDVVLITHADQDHLGALAELIGCRRFSIGRVLVNTDSTKDTDIWNDLAYELNEAHKVGELRFDVSLVQSDDNQYDNGRVHIEVLGPSRSLAVKGPGAKYRDERRITTNSISAAIRLSVGSDPLALFLGDIDDVGLDDLLANCRDIRSPLLVFPHHGGKPGAANIREYVGRLLRAVQPQLIIFSIGRGSYGTPSREVVTAIRQTLPKVTLLCTQLSENCAKAISTPEGTHLSSAFARGKEKGHCCAGTILLIDARTRSGQK